MYAHLFVTMTTAQLKIVKNVTTLVKHVLVLLAVLFATLQQDSEHMIASPSTANVLMDISMMDNPISYAKNVPSNAKLANNLELALHVTLLTTLDTFPKISANVFPGIMKYQEILYVQNAIIHAKLA